jgi:hypothetical protein
VVCYVQSTRTQGQREDRQSGAPKEPVGLNRYLQQREPQYWQDLAVAAILKLSSRVVAALAPTSGSGLPRIIICSLPLSLMEFMLHLRKAWVILTGHGVMLLSRHLYSRVLASFSINKVAP